MYIENRAIKYILFQKCSFVNMYIYLWCCYRESHERRLFAEAEVPTLSVKSC